MPHHVVMQQADSTVMSRGCVVMQRADSTVLSRGCVGWSCELNSVVPGCWVNCRVVLGGAVN